MQAGLEHHELGDSEAILVWIEEVAKARLPGMVVPDRPVQLHRLNARQGHLAVFPMEAQTHRRAAQSRPSIHNYADYAGDQAQAYWLPSRRAAEAWLKASTLPDPSPHSRRPLGALGSPTRPAPVFFRDFIQIDAVPSDWEHMPPLPAPFADKPAGSLCLAWSRRGLWGLMQAKTGVARANAEAPWSASSVELFIEPDPLRAPQRSSTSRQIILGPGADTASPPGSAVIWPRSLAGMVQAAWRPSSEGYLLEFLIPAEILEPALMQRGTTLGFNYVINHEGQAVEEFFCAKSHGGYAIPALWGAVQLVDREP